MSRKTDVDDSRDDETPKLTFFQRLRYTMVKPDDSGKVKEEEPQMSREELEATIARADDKERNIGLIAAPLGAIVTLFISADLIHHAQLTGQSTSTFQTLTFVLLGMAVLMLATAWLRKRLFLGIVMALYGLAIFNLHYWGFGIPYILAGAWLLVRAYRLQRDLKEAKGEGPGRPARGRGAVTTDRPRPNKRYTPPTPSRRSPPPKSKAKPEDEQRAG